MDRKNWQGAWLMARDGDQLAMVALLEEMTPTFDEAAFKEVVRLYPGLQEEGINPRDVPDFDDFMQYQYTTFIESVRNHTGRVAA